jgi:hypothetical protein
MRVGLLRHLAQFLDHMRRRRQIRIAHAEVDNVLACRTRGCPHRVNFRDDIGWQALDTVEFL